METEKKRKILFKNSQSPGDILMLTAAVRDLKSSHPEIEIGVTGTCKQIWENNPHITKLNEAEDDVEVIKVEYPLIHKSNNGQFHFIHGFRKDMEKKLGLEIKPGRFQADIHISDKEKGWINQVEETGVKDQFWIIMAGGKHDFTAKWWNPEYYQQVVDHFKGKITFVQCGEKHHWHPPLKNVISMIGKTDLRQFIRLIYHSIGVLSPITFAMHAAAAIECRYGLKNRPCVVIAGGREPSQWEKYPYHRFLDNNGALGCCDDGGCWRSRCQTVGDGDKKDSKEELCFFPIKINDELSIAKCMYMIKPRDVISAIEMYYEGGVLEYGSPIKAKIGKIK